MFLIKYNSLIEVDDEKSTFSILKLSTTPPNNYNSGLVVFGNVSFLGPGSFPISYKYLYPYKYDNFSGTLLGVCVFILILTLLIIFACFCNIKRKRNGSRESQISNAEFDSISQPLYSQHEIYISQPQPSPYQQPMFHQQSIYQQQQPPIINQQPLLQTQTVNQQVAFQPQQPTLYQQSLYTQETKFEDNPYVESSYQPQTNKNDDFENPYK